MTSRTELNKEMHEKLIEEENREQRKRIIILVLKITGIVLICLFVFYFYTDCVSTRMIITKEERIIDEKIPESFNGFKIIQFSDLYYGSTVSMDELSKLVKEINKRKPDIVIFTGNLFYPKSDIDTKEKEEIIKKLSKIDSTVGKYAVMGKNDEKNVFTTVMNQSNFTILDNQYDLVYNNNSTPILLVGLSSLVNNTRNLETGYGYFKEESHNADIYTISMMSETDDLDQILATYNTDLVLAGNSLNGEIRFPLLGGFIRQEGSSTYKDPYYLVGGTEVFISSGIGSPSLGVRLFNHPSINFFRLSNKG